MTELKRVFADFVPQYEVGDNVYPVEGGKQKIDITESVLLMKVEQIRNLPNATENDDLYYDSPDYDQIGHDGPFEVYVSEANLCEFFGLQKLEDLTDDIVAAKRSECAAPVETSRDTAHLSTDQLVVELQRRGVVLFRSIAELAEEHEVSESAVRANLDRVQRAVENSTAGESISTASHAALAKVERANDSEEDEEVADDEDSPAP